MLLERLSNACGLAGAEDEVRDLLKAELRPHVDEMWTDMMGNLMVRKGSGPIKVMLDAHMDEVGFLVGHIDENGYVRLKKVGGIDDRVIPGRQVWLTSRRIAGVIGAKAWHLISAEERGRAIAFDEMYVDLGCRTKAEVAALGIELGDPVYFATQFEPFSQRVVKGKAFDDRAGCAIIAELLQRHTYPGITLYGAFTCQEEVGLRGAKVAAYNLFPDVAIALDVTPAAEAPGVGAMDTITELGKGPALYLIDKTSIPNRRLVEHLEQLAIANGIPYQFRRTVGGSTDAAGIELQRTGIVVCPVSLPGRYIHSNASLIDLDDLNATVALVHQFLLSVEKGEFRA